MQTKFSAIILLDSDNRLRQLCEYINMRVLEKQDRDSFLIRLGWIFCESQQTYLNLSTLPCQY